MLKGAVVTFATALSSHLILVTYSNIRAIFQGRGGLLHQFVHQGMDICHIYMNMCMFRLIFAYRCMYRGLLKVHYV